MTNKEKLWIYNEEDNKWRNITELFPEDKNLHEVADLYNTHYLDQHYWVSQTQPGKEELGEIRLAKLHEEIEN